MHSDGFAEALMSPERKKWQDPEKVVREIGLSAGMSVADLGCGPGFFTIPLALAVGETGKVYAVDSNERMLSHLKSNDRAFGDSPRAAIVPIAADVAATSIPSGTVDVAFFANVLHDLAEPAAFLKELKRILRKGSGSVVVDVDWDKAETAVGPPLGIRLSVDESKAILREGGFEVIRPIYGGRFHYGLLCKAR